MKNLKSLIALFVVAASISFVACSGEAKTEETPATETATETPAAAPMAADSAAATTAPAADSASMAH